MPISFDSKCYELAEYFLPEYPSRRKELAERIQEAIEDYIEENNLVEG